MDKIAIFEPIKGDNSLTYWDEIADIFYSAPSLEIKVACSNSSFVLKYVFEECRFFSVSKQSDRIMEILENHDISNGLLFGLQIYRNSLLISQRSSIIGVRSYAGCENYVIADDDLWIDVISDALPIMSV